MLNHNLLEVNVLRKNNLEVRSGIQGEQALEQCANFKRVLFQFIKDLNGLLSQPDLARENGYLGQLAARVLEINGLSRNVGACGEEMQMAAQLVQNILTQPFVAKGRRQSTTLLAAAEAFQKEPGAALGEVMTACLQCADDTEALLTSLKVIAYDL